MSQGSRRTPVASVDGTVSHFPFGLFPVGPWRALACCVAPPCLRVAVKVFSSATRSIVIVLWRACRCGVPTDLRSRSAFEPKAGGDVPLHRQSDPEFLRRREDRSRNSRMTWRCERSTHAASDELGFDVMDGQGMSAARQMSCCGAPWRAVCQGMMSGIVAVYQLGHCPTLPVIPIIT